MTLQELETALDSNQLQALMANNRWLTLRRNGRTKLWATRPHDFYIPVKVGFRTYARLGPAELTSPNFRIAPSPGAPRLSQESRS